MKKQHKFRKVIIAAGIASAIALTSLAGGAASADDGTTHGVNTGARRNSSIWIYRGDPLQTTPGLVFTAPTGTSATMASDIFMKLGGVERR